MNTGAGLHGFGPDAWTSHTGVRGFEDFTIKVQTRQVGAERRLVGLALEPNTDAPVEALVLTSSRLRTLPLTTLLEQNRALTSLDLHGWAKAAKKTAAKAKDRPRGGTLAHAQAVAEVYQAASLAGQSPRDAVAEAFDIPAYTADRRIREAREMGVLPPARRNRQEPQP